MIRYSRLMKRYGPGGKAGLVSGMAKARLRTSSIFIMLSPSDRYRRRLPHPTLHRLYYLVCSLTEILVGNLDHVFQCEAGEFFSSCVVAHPLSGCIRYRDTGAF